MKTYHLDTNILIDILSGGRSSAFFRSLLKEGPFRVQSSIICVIEFFSKASPREAQTLSAWIESGDLELIPLDSMTLAREAARLRLAHQIKTPDAIIIASAMAKSAILTTFDQAMTKIARQWVSVCEPG